MGMKIAIIGAGAMGCLYGAYLARNRENVWLNDVWDDHVNKINGCGLSVVSPDESFIVKPRATTIITDIGKADLIIICVKSHHTTEAALVAETLAKEDTLVMTLQNGLGNGDQLAEIFSPQRVFVGATAMGATLLEPGHLMHSGIKPTHIGAMDGDHPALEQIASKLTSAGLPTVVTPDVSSLMWSKLAIHAGINAVTAITKLTNGELLTVPHAVQLAEMAVAEVAAVAKAKGVALLFTDPIAEMHDFAKSMKEHRSSMLQDVTNKRRTEVEAINGMVVAEGKKLAVPTPVNETLMLAIRTIEGM